MIIIILLIRYIPVTKRTMEGNPTTTGGTQEWQLERRQLTWWEVTHTTQNEWQTPPVSEQEP